MSAWLRCQLEQGMFPREYAVEIETSDAGRISLFAPEEKVRVEDSLIRIDLLEPLENSGGGVFVYLPSAPFEISSRTVKVPRAAVIAA